MIRSDKKKNIDKVASSVAKNPLQSVRDIAKDTWMGKSTVATHLDNLDNLGQKDDRIHTLTDKDFNCIKLWVEEIERRLENKDELKKLRVTEISQVIKENTARYTLFRWSATDKEWWINKIDVNVFSMTPEEVNNQIKEVIK